MRVPTLMAGPRRSLSRGWVMAHSRASCVSGEDGVGRVEG